MVRERSCGILCHPTSMPGRYGIGDLGDGVLRFIDFLVAAGQTLWQVLPLGPTGYGDSPYQPFSAFAGNPLLIDLEQLIEGGLLIEADLAPIPPFPDDRVSYGEVIDFKDRVLQRSYRVFVEQGSEFMRAELAEYREANRDWLDDYALFMALKSHFDWAPWTEWERDIALHEGQALSHWHDTLREDVNYQRYLQFLFDRQWRRVRCYASDAGINVIGDIPIFVGHDSADVWGHRELFRLDDQGHPTVVAGVPPDYFSATGQLWGNPHYHWDVMKKNGYAWWIARLQRVLSQVDMVRLDHFRGFAGYWQVPADDETAINGRWVWGPGKDLFLAAKRELGKLPIIAEDLGTISPDVVALREEFGLPGMKVLQFAFDADAKSPNLPHNYDPNCVVYTGTHDNDTTLGWYTSRDEDVKHKVRIYAGTDGSDIHWTLVRLAMTSVADMAIFPLQDALGLGGEARLNLPGRPHGNWAWRYREEALRPKLADALRELAVATGRWVEEDEEKEEDTSEIIEYEDPYAPPDALGREQTETTSSVGRVGNPPY